MGWGLPPDIYILCRCFFCSFLKAGRQGWGGGEYIVKFSELAQIFLVYGRNGDCIMQKSDLHRARETVISGCMTAERMLWVGAGSRC